MNFGTSRYWCESQKLAFDSLTEVADLFFNTEWSNLSIAPGLTPRWSFLLIGQSGIGKSHVIREVAKEFGLPCLRMTPGNWVPAATRDSTPTLLQVHRFVTDHDSGGILHFDELDKFRGIPGSGSPSSGDWDKAVALELLDLLDRAPSAPIKSVEWTADVLRSLKRNFLIFGSGTFQQFWTNSSKSKVGFGTPESAQTTVANIRRQIQSGDILAPEILKRFNHSWQILTPPTESEFKLAAESLGLAKWAHDLRMPLDFKEAEKSGLGARWLEETLSQLLLQARRFNRTDLLGPRAYVPDVSEEPDPFFEGEDYDPVL